ncbi:glyoxalase superfamily protein [Agromyces atrinae]|uniref:Bleomycin resistance protein n=1 Tax=Agromyces atrinae TaxID=592376 RepID=A0A4Q2M3Q5_9MICO|nr:glyoxalase superfamily protein [Agromyces atrinae]NYD66125.1 catechol 2,3-dioxygenase-like lactoylglutathione lyase family enzyme [Agromyces atrinae]RXZ86469.1 VOC family protein [Agromyces atrinae]
MTSFAAGSAMPILRVVDAERARSFYVDVLGFTVEFTHRFGARMPVFLGVRLGKTTLGLSEHHGDGTPGSVVWIPLRRLTAYHSFVSKAAGGHLRPGIDADAPVGPTMSIIDPFGNELRFCESR